MLKMRYHMPSQCFGSKDWIAIKAILKKEKTQQNYHLRVMRASFNTTKKHRKLRCFFGVAGVGLKTLIYQPLIKVMCTPYVSPALFSSPALPVLRHIAHSRILHRTKSGIQAGMMHTRIQRL